MEYTEVVKYFKNIATRLKKVKHDDKSNNRFIIDFNDELSQKWGGMKGFFIVLSVGVGKFMEHSPWFFDSKRIAIEVHGHCVNTDNIVEKEKVRTEVEALAKQIIARMIIDSEDFNSCPRFMQKFNPSTAIYEHFESVVPNFLTCILSFDIVDEEFIEIIETEWL